MTRRRELRQGRERGGMYGVSRADRCAGASPFKALKTEEP